MTASLRVDRGRVTVSLRNETDAPVRIPRALLAPALAFEVMGEDGSPVALGPPPVPRQARALMGPPGLRHSCKTMTFSP